MGRIAMAEQHDALVSVKWNEPLEIVLLALEHGWASVRQLREAIFECRQQRPRIGELAISNRLLTISEVFRVLEHEATHGGLFGENAVSLGYFTEAQLYELLQQQSDKTPKVWQVLLEKGTLTREQVEQLQAEVDHDDLYPQLM